MLLSDDYRAQLEKIHKRRHFGSTAQKQIKTIKRFLPEEGTVLDYGSGAGGFKRALGTTPLQIVEYEPGKEELANNNIPCDFVVCIDVLEHIEPELIDNVLDDLQRCVLSGGYFTISCRPAKKTLPDGRNAHLIIEKPEWWEAKLKERFRIVKHRKTETEYWVEVAKK